MSIFDSFRKLFQRPQEIRMPRRWPRIVMTDATVVSLSGGQRQPVKLTNLSAGGARIVSSFALGSHERVTLTVPLGSGSRKDLPAEVVYCKRDDHSLYYAEGLSFLSAGRDGVEEISSFIEEERRRRSGSGELWQG
jgi:hypothetical protein